MMSSESAQTEGNRIMTHQNAEYLLSNTNDKESLEENKESLNGTSDFLQRCDRDRMSEIDRNAF